MEVQGGIFSRKSGHKGKGAKDDMEKLNVAQTMGWTVLQVTPDEIKNGSWVQIFFDAFDVWLVRVAPFLAEDRITLPSHLRSIHQ
jgi:hypothetical protein